MRRLRPHLLVPTLLTIAAAQSAESTTAPEQTPTLPEAATIVITATRLSADPFSQPYALHQIDGPNITERNARTMIDALDRTPGVFIQRTAGNQASPYIRGLTGQQTLLLFDGVRLNNAMFRSGPNQYAAMLPDEAIDHVDVILGTGTTMLGSDGLTGAIDFRLAPSGREQEVGLSPWAKGRYGSAEGGSESAGLDGRMGQWLYSVDGSLAEYQHVTGGSRADRRLFGTAANGDIIPHTGYDQYSVGGRIAWLGLDQQRIELAAGRVQQSDAGRPDGYFENTNTPSAISRYYDPQTFDYIHLRHSTNGGTLWDRSIATLWFHRHRETQIREDLQNFGVPTQRYRRREFRDAVMTLGADLQLTHLYQQHELTYGSTLYRDSITTEYQSYRSPSGNSNPAAAVIFQNDTTNPELTTIPDNSRFTGLAAFVQDFWRVDEQWNVLAGARYDHITWTLPITAARAGFAAFGNGDLTADANAVTTNIRVSRQLSDPWLTWAGISQGFRTPTASDLAGTQDRASSSSGTANGPQTEGNPNLQPETSLTFEWGTRMESGADHCSFALFHTRLKDLITTRFVDVNGDGVISNLPPATNPDRAMRDNASQAVLQGGEIACDFAIPFPLPAAWRLSFFQNTSFVDGEVLVPQPIGNDAWEHLSRANTLTGTVGVKIADQSSWYVLAQIRWADGYDEPAPGDALDVRMTIPGDGTGRMPGWAVCDVKAGIEANQGRWRIDVGAENLGNITYRQVGSGADSAGLNLIASAQVRF